MPEFSALWVPGARKEAMDLLEHLWAKGDDSIRQRLTTALAEGPPLGLYADSDDPERSRDRRQFDRIAFVRRSPVPLTPDLEAIYQALLQKYEGWRIADGDQARFNAYTQVFGHDLSDTTVDTDIGPTTAADLLAALETDQVANDVVDGWRRYLSANPKAGLDIVGQLFATPGEPAFRLVRVALIGLRDAFKETDFFHTVLSTLQTMPPPFWNEHAIAGEIADLLKDGSQASAFAASAAFWTVFDQTLAATADDPANRDIPDDDDWVMQAINRPAGYLAAALFNALYSLRFTADAAFPAEQIQRLNAMLRPGDARFRLARVIAASRLSYLFAVDPKWSRQAIIPCLDWRDDTEALACWQGFAWHPRLSQDLWTVVKDNFFELFSAGRLERLKDFKRTIVEILMLAGIEFSPADLPADKSRQAIIALTDDLRRDAIWWLWTFLSDRSGVDAKEASERVDKIWRDRVQPWLKRVWPHAARFKTPEVAGSMGLCAVATADAFPEAVAFFAPFLVVGENSTFQETLRESDHPERHPAAALDLMTQLIDLDHFRAFFDELAELIERIGRADPTLRTVPAYRRFETFILARQ